MARFEELDVWKRSARLSAEIYKTLVELKDYGFRDQITRAGLSIPSNVAEGYERNSNKELALFLNYAKGSAGELRTQIHWNGNWLHQSRSWKELVARSRGNIKNAPRPNPHHQSKMKVCLSLNLAPVFAFA